jgi:hypothetical protein
MAVTKNRKIVHIVLCKYLRMLNQGTKAFRIQQCVLLGSKSLQETAASKRSDLFVRMIHKDGRGGGNLRPQKPV